MTKKRHYTLREAHELGTVHKIKLSPPPPEPPPRKRDHHREPHAHKTHKEAK